MEDIGIHKTATTRFQTLVGGFGTRRRSVAERILRSPDVLCRDSIPTASTRTKMEVAGSEPKAHPPLAEIPTASTRVNDSPHASQCCCHPHHSNLVW